jgi:hypothetical protein
MTAGGVQSPRAVGGVDGAQLAPVQEAWRGCPNKAQHARPARKSFLPGGENWQANGYKSNHPQRLGTFDR